MQHSYNAQNERHLVVVVRETCSACQLLFQHLHAIVTAKAALPGDVWLVSMEHARDVPALHAVDIQSVPSFYVVQNGAVVDSKAGVHPSTAGMLDIMRGMLNG